MTKWMEKLNKGTMSDVFKALIERISSYQIFNFLYPGLLITSVLGYKGVFSLDDMHIGFFLLFSYFAGMVASRVGSIIIEELLLWLEWINKPEYKRLNDAKQKENSPVTLQLELCNMFRTLCASALLLLIVAFVQNFVPIGYNTSCTFDLAVFLIFVIFLISFIKQYGYLNKCIEANL